MMKYKKLSEKIEWWLSKHPSLKDDDYRLCSNIWYDELLDLGLEKRDFLSIYAKGKLSSAPSIKRARAKLQEESPKYRGKKYALRKSKMQSKWKEQLGYKTNNWDDDEILINGKPY